MELNKIQNIDNLDLFKWNTSLKEWNLKNLEGFLIKDWFYFNEYWKVDTNNIISEFIKKNKKKWQYLYDLIKKWDISLNFTWHVTCASWLWYTLDKISFISLWYRKKTKMIEIFSDDWSSITVTKKLKILTNTWYKESQNIKIWDDLVWILWNSYNWFKNWWIKKNFIDILIILREIKQELIKQKISDIEILKLNKKYLTYLNIIWINTAKKIISIQEINFLIDNIEKGGGKDDESEDITNKESFWDVWWLNRKNIFIKKVVKVNEIEILDWYIWSIVSKLAQNYIINNIILKK